MMAIPRKRPLDCPIEVTLSAMSARWKARILWCLADAPSSYGALRANVAGISDRMLTVQLSELMTDGVVEAEESAKSGTYRLSAIGLSLLPVLDAMKAWGTSVIESRESNVTGNRATGAEVTSPARRGGFHRPTSPRGPARGQQGAI